MITNSRTNSMNTNPMIANDRDLDGSRAERADSWEFAQGPAHAPAVRFSGADDGSRVSRPDEGSRVRFSELEDEVIPITARGEREEDFARTSLRMLGHHTWVALRNHDRSLIGLDIFQPIDNFPIDGSSTPRETEPYNCLSKAVFTWGSIGMLSMPNATYHNS